MKKFEQVTLKDIKEHCIKIQEYEDFCLECCFKYICSNSAKSIDDDYRCQNYLEYEFGMSQNIQSIHKKATTKDGKLLTGKQFKFIKRNYYIYNVNEYTYEEISQMIDDKIKKLKKDKQNTRHNYNSQGIDEDALEIYGYFG